ncbi:MAG: PQQ-binding-like beta-propeller repeat protein [Planctomycetales bacterium]
MRGAYGTGLIRGVAVMLVCGAVGLQANDWPTFRGLDRLATSKDTGLLKKWPEKGPKLVWESKGVGRGYASLAVAGDFIYTLGDGSSITGDKDEYLFCFERGTGKPVWHTKTGAAWNSGKPDWQSSRSTPSVDGDRVYVVTPEGVLFCCEAATGKELWRKNLKEAFGGKKGDGWGYSESVLVDGDNVICTPGGEKETVVALNKISGDEVWKCVREGDRGAGHSSVAISQIGGEKIYVQSTASGPIGIRASDGKLLWSYPVPQTTAIIPTPIIRDDLVFFVAGYKRGGALLRQVPEGDGKVSIKEIYGLKPPLANKHGGVVLVGDYLYGDSDDQGIPYCADLMTGEIKWKTRGNGKGSAAIAVADGHLYIHYASGLMVLANADPKAYKEVSKFSVPGSGERPSWAHPVIVDGKLYLRENDRILCYDLKG